MVGHVSDGDLGEVGACSVISLALFSVATFADVLARGWHDQWCGLVASVQAVDGGAEAGGGFDVASNEKECKAFWSDGWVERFRKDDVTKFEREIGLKSSESIEELVSSFDLSEYDASSGFIFGFNNLI